MLLQEKEFGGFSRVTGWKPGGGGGEDEGSGGGAVWGGGWECSF